MKQELDNLVTELCTFDTELAKDPALVRRMVKELQQSKPTAVVDDAFRAKLRAALLCSPMIPAPRRVVPWWLLYTAPLGVVALVLMLVGPALAPSPYMTPSNLPTMPDDIVMKMSPMMSSDADRGAITEGVERTMALPASTDYFTAALFANTVEVTYLTITRPSYIMVADAAHMVVAVSDLISPGEQTDYTFTPRVPFVPAKIYTATLYYDNGDGVFAKESDEVAVDGTGVAVSLPLTLP